MTTEDRVAGIGFAFFCWHSLKYPGHPGDEIPHCAGQQRVCRAEFHLREQLSALEST